MKTVPMKNIYLIRHCQAVGQEPEAPLTNQGIKDAVALIDFFRDKKIDVIYSSPFLRAVETIRPFADSVGLKVNLDDRLKERVLSSWQVDDWMAKLESSYMDLDLTFEGGESSREAMRRGVECIEGIAKRPESNFIVVSHGALLSLIIKHYDSAFGFKEWKSMRNPDIFVLRGNLISNCQEWRFN
jgi:2,3-bisphosphoglycerate-dependent phosphoglycerate mutase